MTKENFSGFVLIGGKSSRMKKDKAFLKLDGETFLERALRILHYVCGHRVQIVVNSNQKTFLENAAENLNFVFDIHENRGAVGGIHAALKNCATEFAVILAVDLPFVEAETVARLMQIAISEKEFSAIVPGQSDGRRQPLCAVYRTADCLPAAENLLSENISVSMREFLETIRFKVIDEKLLSESLSNFVNVNTPQDYENLKIGK